MNTDIFAADQAATQAAGNAAVAAPAAQSNPLDNLLGAIKNDRGEPKYQTVEAALVALAHSQVLIPELKQKLSERELALQELQSSQTKPEDIADLVKKLTQPNSQAQATAPATIDEEGIATIVGQKLEQAQKKQQEQANQRAVVEALTKQFGAEKGSQMFYSKAQELGLGKDEINALAAKSPQAVLSMLGVSGGTAPKPVSIQPPSSTVRPAVDLSTNTGSFIGRETQTIPLGGGSEQQKVAFENSRKMVEELHAQGLTVQDLTDPSVYFKYFK